MALSANGRVSECVCVYLTVHLQENLFCFRKPQSKALHSDAMRPVFHNAPIDEMGRAPKRKVTQLFITVIKKKKKKKSLTFTKAESLPFLIHSVSPEVYS